MKQNLLQEIIETKVSYNDFCRKSFIKYMIIKVLL
jgi:hypothetical protein